MIKYVFNRYEHKYILDLVRFNRILPELEKYTVPDEYSRLGNTYPIDNIYYDTEDDYLIRRSLQKPKYKEKLRLRSYGVPSSGSLVFLELKKKYNGLVNKRRTAITLEKAESFIRTGIVPEDDGIINRQVADEIAYFLSIYKVYPKVVLSYDRIAYFSEDDSDLRISFDFNIRARRSNLSLTDGDYGDPILSKHLCLMEIKTSKSIPLWLTHILTENELHSRSFSKYGTEYINTVSSQMEERYI